MYSVYHTLLPLHAPEGAPMLGRSTRAKRSNLLRHTARITALSLSATMMVGGAALTASAVSVADPADCTAPDSCATVEVYADDPTGLLSAEDVTVLREGTTIELVNASGVTVASVKMRPDSGFFESMQNVPAGTYTAKVTLPEGYKTLEMNRSGLHWAAGSATSDPFEVTGWNVQIPLVLGPDVETGAIAVDVFSDMDRDGAKDAGEGALYGFSAQVYSADGATSITSIGSAALSTGPAVVNLPVGTYQVHLFRPTGWSHLNGTFGTANSGTVEVTANGTATVSYGMRDDADCAADAARCGTLTAYAFTTDAQSARSPQAAVQVALLDATGAILKYATTSADGTVSFAAAPGLYSLQVVHAADLAIAAGGDFDATTATTAQQTVQRDRTTQLELALAAGDGIGDAPVDDREQGTVNVIGFVDANGNGQYDGGDPTVTAWATLSSATMSPIVVRSNGGASLPEGEYAFDLTNQPAGWKAVTAAGTFTLDGQHVLYVQMEQTDVAPAGKAMIRVDAWYDANGDGVKDPSEVPAPDLYFDLNAGDGTFVGWTATGKEGLGVFDAQPAGTYTATLDFDPEYDPAGLAVVSGDLDAKTRTSAQFTVQADETKTLAVGVVDNEHPLVADPGGPTDPQDPQGPREPEEPKGPDAGPTTPPADPADPQDDVLKVKQGEKLTVRGDGFAAGETVDIWVHSDPVKLGETVAAANGEVSAEVTIPVNLPPGAHRIELRGQQSGVSVWTAIEVTAADAAPAEAGGTSTAGTLAETGAGELGVMLLGIGAMLGMGGLMLARKPEVASEAA